MHVGVLVRLVAQEGKRADLSAFISSAIGIVNNEPGTVWWIAYETDEAFWIVDVSPNQAALRAHLDGDVPKALMERAPELLAAPPEFIFGSVIASKPSL
jgi:quinol monooxygenase YgiN